MHDPSHVRVTGPLAPFAPGFAAALAEQGYKSVPIAAHLVLMAHVSRHRPVARHESSETTQVYVHADMSIKERALARTTPHGVTPGRYKPADPLLAFLESL